MSQIQSEVRPQVKRMPMGGFVLQTGGSARRRIIKPLNAQAATDQFPIRNEYRITGVPGHTHNSSAVVSVLVDLSKERGFSKTFNVWSSGDIEMKTTDPGDSEIVRDEDIRFNRAIERGIGEICVRPENCHHEIREPARSIAEVRTLVAPDDRLQTLTYVEEVGGFITLVKRANAPAADTNTIAPYISDFPNVFVDLQGFMDPNDAAMDVAGLLTNVPTTTPVRIASDKFDGTNIVVTVPAGESIGTLDDGSAWYGIVEFRWDSTDMLYRSDPFDVTLRQVVEVSEPVVAPDTPRTLRVRFPAIETTRAENGYCFLMARNINVSQAIQGATAANSDQFRPRIPIDVLDATTDLNVQFYWEPDCAYRIMVGGQYVFPGPSVNPARTGYFEVLKNLHLSKLTADYQTAFATLGANAGSWTSATVLDQDEMYAGLLAPFSMMGSDRPRVDVRNSQPGAFWGNIVLANGTPALCMSTISHADVTDETTNRQNGQHVITKALAAGGSWASSRPGGAGPLITFTETDVRSTYNFSSVIPPFFSSQVGFDPTNEEFAGFENDAESLWYWAKTVLPTYTIDITAQTADFGDGLGVVAVPVQYQIPPSHSWFQSKGAQTKDLFVTVPAGGAIGAIVPTAVDDAVIMIPAILEYYTKDCVDFAYVAGLDAANVEQLANSQLIPLVRTETKRFYVVGQLTVDQAVASFGIKDVDVASLFSLTKSISAATEFDLHVVDVRLVPDMRGSANAGIRNANQELYEDGWCYGNAFECVHQTQADAHPVLPDHRFPVLFKAGANEIYISNVHFSFEENRTFFIATNQVGTRAAVDADDSGFYFNTRDCRTVVYNDQAGGHLVCTVVGTIYKSDATRIDATGLVKLALANNQHDLVALVHLGKHFQDAFVGDPQGGGQVTIFDDLVAEGSLLGPVFQSKRRISQHLCAPVLNPNMRIGCSAPLNFETGHLPPELRDFRLELRDVNFSFLPGKVNLESLVLYEFNGGNQAIAAEDNLLSLPQFRSMSAEVEADGSFEFEMFSPYGMPSYIALFCRDTDHSRDHMTQPLIKQLSIMCATTQKKSNTILEANVHQLYHITQRNVNQRARYNRSVFTRRQVILMSAEDIGMMGLSLREYQLEKRAQFEFKGTTDQLGRVTVLLIFNNRGLYVQGKHMSVVRLKHE
jgi:hypothetical protein